VAGSLNSFSKGMAIPFRRLIAVTLLFSSSFAWFQIFYKYFDEFSPVSIDSIWHSAGTVALLVSALSSALVGSFIAKNTDRRKLLLVWLVSGIVAVIPIPFFSYKELLPIWCAAAGLSLGIGFPSCLAFFAESAKAEERGRVGGVMILVTFVFTIVASVLKDALALGAIGIVALLIALRSIGFISIALDPVHRIKKKVKPWHSVIGYRDFNLYVLAYMLFQIAAGLVYLFYRAVPDTPIYNEYTQIGSSIRLVGALVFALLTGFVADRAGRKKPLVFGLFLLGAGYALVGLVTTPSTYLATLLISGFAWGIILVIYLAVPGDLAFAGSAERFYAVGWILPLILYTGVEGAGSIIGFTPRIDVFAVILMFILFASILPVLYAVETLSESKIREREILEYTKKVARGQKKKYET
jgi:MFS family permease